MLTKESEAFLNALVPAEGATTTDHTEAIYGLIEPLYVVLDEMDAHLQAIDKLRRAADRAEENPKVYGWFERFKQNVEGGRRLAMEAKRSLEALSDLCFQMDRYAIEMRDTLNAKAKLAAGDTGDRIVLSKAEHGALKATARHANDELAKALKELESLRPKE